MAAKSHYRYTGNEPKDLIEVSSECTAMNLPSGRNSFTTDIDDVPTVVASDITETVEARQLTSPLFTQEREKEVQIPSVVCDFSASSSKRQPTAASIIKCDKSLANV